MDIVNFVWQNIKFPDPSIQFIRAAPNAKNGDSNKQLTEMIKGFMEYRKERKWGSLYIWFYIKIVHVKYVLMKKK